MSFGSEGRCELARINAQFNGSIEKVLADRRDKFWVLGMLMMLRSKTGDLKRVVERVPASHCSFVLHTLEFHLFDHLEKIWRDSEAISSQARSRLIISTRSLSSRVK